MKLKTMVTAGFTLLLATTLGLVGGVVFVYLGIYNIAADEPHSAVERALLTAVKSHSIHERAEELEAKLSEDPALVQRGLRFYRRACVQCHGAPGEAPWRMGVGLNPNPPPLEVAADKWSPEEIFWITKNGIKMAGMPAFGLSEDEQDLWAVTAFVIRMSTLSPAEYWRMVEAVERPGPSVADIPWVAPAQGWAELREAGDVGRGRERILYYGCGACHVIPTVVGADGLVGPPLTSWRKRHYVAGRVVNTPFELVRWISDPRAIKPHTAMPDLGVSEAEAWDISAFLYTLE